MIKSADIRLSLSNLLHFSNSLLIFHLNIFINKSFNHKHTFHHILPILIHNFDRVKIKSLLKARYAIIANTRWHLISSLKESSSSSSHHQNSSTLVYSFAAKAKEHNPSSQPTILLQLNQRSLTIHLRLHRRSRLTEHIRMRSPGGSVQVFTGGLQGLQRPLSSFTRECRAWLRRATHVCRGCFRVWYLVQWYCR